MRHSRPDHPLLITSAPENPDVEFEHRRRRYAIMMGGRAVAVVAAFLTYHFSIWLAIAFLVAGAVLPWAAVILANDGPPHKHGAPGLTASSGEKALPSPEHPDRTMDG